MARIRCHYVDCVFLDEGYCTAAAVEIDPDTGCATYSPTEQSKEEEWDEEEETDEWEEDEEEEEEEGWDEDEDEF
ncbi:MAG TPA: hypothetical protein VHM28_07995 [Anaerolineales bacterium]|jgi:hypothetical protein|nr:hypothetical protein [Anaerolineales bacterium]